MTVCESHDLHTFNSIDLPTSDVTGAKQFYGELFGWKFEDTFFPDGQLMYTTATLNGHKVANMSELMPEQIEEGMPPFWNSYVCVKDVRASLAKCLELGAEILEDAFDIPEAGSMAMVREPNGALFSMWQPKQHIGMQVKYEPGAPCWFELDTNDVAASEEFYCSAFEWTTAKDPNNPVYTLFNNCGATPANVNVGGMMEIMPEWGEVQPNWLVFFQVDNVGASVQLAAKIGGEALHEIMDFPYGRLTTLKDPQGGVFGLMEMNV